MIEIVECIKDWAIFTRVKVLVNYISSKKGLMAIFIRGVAPLHYGLLKL